MLFDKTKKNLIYVNAVYHDNKTGQPNLVGLIQSIHIANQIPAMPVFLVSRDVRAVQTAVLIAYALGIMYPQQNIYKNPNLEVFWKETLDTMISENNLSDRCLAVAISNRAVINEVSRGTANRNGDIAAFKSSSWDGIFEGNCPMTTSKQVEWSYMQDNFVTGRPLKGFENDFAKALHFKKMYKFIEYFKKSKSDIMRHQIYSQLYDNSF